MKFRDNLLHLRQQRNMTQEQLAMLLGVSRQSVAKWEAGQSMPEVDKLVKMAGVGHASFTRAHPFVEDFYMPAQKEAEQRSFARFLTAGIALILVGVVAVIVTGVSENEQIQEIGAAALLALVAGGVWYLVRGGIVHGMTDVENYNRERADEQWERDNPQVGRACGIIMLAATALGLLLLFARMAASDAGNSGLAAVCSYFWVVWPVGGIACAITSLAMKAAAGK